MLSQLLQRLTNELEGDWLLVGGSLVALWLNEHRVTEDIDLVGVPGTNEQRYALIEFCTNSGLPAELMNSAADYFLRKIPDWTAHTIPFMSGQRGRILRPTTTLFVLLKLTRLSETDLDDCRSLLNHDQREPIDAPRVLTALAGLPHTDDDELSARRELLRQLVDHH